MAYGSPPYWNMCEFFCYSVTTDTDALDAVGSTIFTNDNFDRNIDAFTDSVEIIWHPHLDQFFETGAFLYSVPVFAPALWTHHFAVIGLDHAAAGLPTSGSTTVDVVVKGCFPSIMGAYHGIGGDFDGGPNPMRDLVAKIPDSVVDVSAYSWVDEAGASIGTPSPPPPAGGGSWGLPPRPLSGVTWTEAGRWSPTVGVDPRTGESVAGAGIWHIPIDLDTDLRDGKLTIVLGLDAFFDRDSATLGQLTTLGSGAVPLEYQSETWEFYPLALGPIGANVPPFRQRQRSLLTSSHAAQARAHPVITQARGDIG